MGLRVRGFPGEHHLPRRDRRPVARWGSSDATPATARRLPISGCLPDWDAIARSSRGQLRIIVQELLLPTDDDAGAAAAATTATAATAAAAAAAVCCC